VGVGKVARGGLAGIIMRWAARLRFPYLLALTLVVFVVNVFVPDALPFADEIVLGLFSVLLASLRKKKPEDGTGDEETGAA
jgi:uncharacterized membrane protein YdfJ with MMPL/SSD domain